MAVQQWHFVAEEGKIAALSLSVPENGVWEPVHGAAGAGGVGMTSRSRKRTFLNHLGGDAGFVGSAFPWLCQPEPSLSRNSALLAEMSWLHSQDLFSWPHALHYHELEFAYPTSLLAKTTFP